MNAPYSPTIPAAAAAQPRAPRVRRPWAQLYNAVLDLAGPEAEFVSHDEHPWASVTFSGSRHTFTLAFTGPAGIAAGEAFAEALGEHEFAIPRQIVVEALINAMLHEAQPAERMLVEAELLLVEDQ